MTRLTRQSLTLFVTLAVLAVALVSLQCPRVDCLGCAGDEVVAKQASPLWLPVTPVAATALVLPFLFVGSALAPVSAVPDAPDLHERSSRLLI